MHPTFVKALKTEGKMSNKKRSLIERLNSGPVICAEGFLFEIEKRGYMASGEFVPMVSLEHPEALENLHREIGRAHVWTPVTGESRMPSSAWKKKTNQ